MDAYVARQPIFDRDKNIFGYELLFRNGMANFVPDVDGDAATSSLLSSSFFTMGMDRITGGKKAFINFTQNLLQDKIPTIFPKESIIVEVLEDVSPDEAVIEACQAMSAEGYVIALDDFMYRPELEPLVALADIVKIDLRAVPIDQMADYLETIAANGTHYLAEKVETYEEFNRSLELGFEYFQGYFFCKPEIIRGKEISSSELSIMRLMAEVNKADTDFASLQTIVEQDIAMSYKLMCYMNSAFFKRANEISSVRQALILMGIQEIRRFVSMIAMARLVTDKPDELIRISFGRAKFFELLARQTNANVPQAELFTLGLFSMIDAILDQPMEKIMDKMPLSQPLTDALVEEKGDLAVFLNIAKCYERGNWEELDQFTGAFGIDAEKLPALYWEACEWGNNMVDCV